MTLVRVLLLPVLLAFASCAISRPVVYNDSTRVSAGDIQVAIELVQQRCLREKRGFLPVYRVDVDRFDRIYVRCGPHYGLADAACALTFTVERKEKSWRITGMSPYIPNPERIIIT
jgi:hypothetical protein